MDIIIGCWLLKQSEKLALLSKTYDNVKNKKAWNCFMVCFSKLYSFKDNACCKVILFAKVTMNYVAICYFAWLDSAWLEKRKNMDI